MSSAQNDQVKLRKRLEALLKLPDNQTCADCRKRGPRWASANLGIFICIECSGIHRNLGVHISFVRSVNLDSWTKQQVEFMEEWGNGRANEYFEANVPSHVIRPKEGDPVRVVERFIRDKYEFKKYIAKSLPPKHESQVEVDAEPESVVARRASKHHGHHGHGHAHHGHQSQQHRQEEAPKVVEAPKPAAPAPAPSLIDFMDDPAPAPAPVTQQATVTSSSDPFGTSSAFPVTNGPPANVFDPFAGSAQPVPSQGGFNAFDSSAPQGNFATGAVPPAPSGFDFMAQPQQQPQPPKASADAILSLYSANMNRGGPMPMPMGGGFNQPMYPPNHPPPMMNVNPNQQMPRPMGFGQMPGYPPQMHQQPPYQGMNFNQGPPPINPFAPNGGMPMQQGYPGNFQQQFPQLPANPFQPNPGMPPMQMNSQFQGGWQR